MIFWPVHPPPKNQLATAKAQACEGTGADGVGAFGQQRAPRKANRPKQSSTTSFSSADHRAAMSLSGRPRHVTLS